MCAQGLGLVRDDISPAVASAIKSRIVIGQSLYAFGALLCLVSIMPASDSSFWCN